MNVAMMFLDKDIRPCARVIVSAMEGADAKASAAAIREMVELLGGNQKCVAMDSNGGAALYLLALLMSHVTPTTYGS